MAGLGLRLGLAAIAAGWLMALGGSALWGQDPHGLALAGLAPADGAPLRLGLEAQDGPAEAVLLLAQAAGGAPLLEGNRRKEVADALARAALQRPNDIALRLALGEQLARLGDGVGAQAVLNHAPGADTEDPAWLMARAAADIAAGEVPQGASLVEWVLTRRPGWAEAWVRLAEAKQRMGDAAGAVQARKRAEACGSVGAEAWHVLGSAALDQDGRPAQAVALLERAWALAPGRSGTANNLGNAYHALHAAASAALWFHRAAAADPTNPQPMNGLGVLHQEAKRWPQALEAFQQAIARDEGCFEAWYNAGVALRRLGRGQEADAAWARARALSPGHPAWRRAARP